GTGSSGDQAPDKRKPTFSLVLGSLAHDRRLRSDPYDPQRPGARKRAGGDGWSTPLLHSWFVQRGDGLILRTRSPNFALTPKLQHYQGTHQAADKAPLSGREVACLAASKYPKQSRGLRRLVARNRR